MEDNEKKWDDLLRIKTSGRDDTEADNNNYPYEPTPYSVLERLASSGYLTKKNVLVDYGCGKGRVDFFLSFQTKCRSIGIEYNERIYQCAEMNRERAASAGRTEFCHEKAQEYQVGPEVDRFYFFNPFSVKILQGVMERIRESFYENPRKMQLFFYYPSSEYVAYLLLADELQFVDEIDCKDLFLGEDQRERILIFEWI